MPERTTVVAMYRKVVIGIAIIMSPIQTYITYLAVKAGWDKAQIARYTFNPFQGQNWKLTDLYSERCYSISSRCIQTKILLSMFQQTARLWSVNLWSWSLCTDSWNSFFTTNLDSKPKNLWSIFTPITLIPVLEPPRTHSSYDSDI